MEWVLQMELYTPCQEQVENDKLIDQRRQCENSSSQLLRQLSLVGSNMTATPLCKLNMELKKPHFVSVTTVILITPFLVSELLLVTTSDNDLKRFMKWDLSKAPSCMCKWTTIIAKRQKRRHIDQDHMFCSQQTDYYRKYVTSQKLQIRSIF